jgi:nitroreductase
MEVMEAIKKRYSVRKYADREIDDETLLKIMEAARLAPSAKNRQEWKFIIIRDRAKKEKMVEVAKGQEFVKEASAIIAGVSTEMSYTMTCGVPARHIDIAIAMEHIALAATSYGLGTCWIGAFYQDKAKELLKVPENCEVVALMTLGYPEGGQGEKIRKSIDEIICYEEFC